MTEDDDPEEGFKVECPGKYFAPFGPLIPAGGHLLLAIVERLFRDRGLPYALCDTDALCPAARPADMSREQFRKAVREVAGPDGWFQRLSPYSDDEPPFAVEDVNYRPLDDTSGKVSKELEPLYCLVISAKRYVMFNIAPPSKRYPKGQTIIRKISGHGLGHLRRIDEYDSGLHKLTKPEHVAAVSTIEDAARYGNYDDRCEETDWGSIQAAIDVLTGRAKRPTEILNSSMIDEDEGGRCRMGSRSSRPEYIPPAVEYWEPPARRQRARTAAALRVARHRKRKNDASS